MKKFGRKLFLSCAALAACATTLVSTTFAWYTSNTEVSAGSLQALSSASVDSSSFYIASAATYDENKAVATMNPYGPSADPVTVAGKTDDKLNTTFAPVYYNTSDGTYKQLTGATGDAKDTPAYADQANVDILEFVYRFRITNPGADVANVPVYFKTFSVTNTVDGNLPTQKANTAGFTSEQTGISTAGTDYAVDILKAMKMNITITKMTSETVLSSQAADKSVNVYDLANYATKADVNIAKNNEQVPIPNALGFYNCIMRTALTAPTTNYESGTVLTQAKANAPLFYIPGDTGYVEVRFAFYLDGWDSYCYDVCRQQGINVVMDFTSASASAAETISGYAAATNWA